MRGLVYVRRLAVAIGAVTLVALALAIPAFATTGSYAATSSSTVRAGTTEASLSTPTDLKVTLTNTSSSSTSYKLGSANITFPGCSTPPPCAGGFALQQGTVAVTATGGNNWSAKVVGNVVQIRTPETSSNYLVPGKSVTVTVKAVAAPTKTGVYALSTIAKDDGDYDNSTLASTGTASITVKPGPLDTFVWTQQPLSSPTAGSPFVMAATAYDRYGNVKTDYSWSGATLSGLVDSPNSDHAAYPRRSGSPAGGVGGSATFDVTAFLAGLGQHVIVTDTSTNIGQQSNDFTVNPGRLTLAFEKQPASAKHDTIIPSTTPPDAITVSAIDDYGNRAVDGTLINMTAPTFTAGSTTGVTTLSGRATFGNLSISVNGTYSMTAALASWPGSPAQSQQFVIADNVCTGVSVCTATASNGNQTSSAKITTADPGLFQSIVLATTFLAPAQSNCSGFTLVPGTDLTDVSILNGNVTAAKPTFLVTLIIPKATLQTAGYTSRSASSFDVCVGAKWIDNSTAIPWKTKAGIDSTLTDGFYWGLAPDCSTAGLSPENPCALLKTKNANQLLGVIGSLPPGVSFSNSDIALVVRMAYPWDGRYGGG